MKLRPITDQTGSYIYDASKEVTQLLKPLARNEFTINDTLAFPELLKNTEKSDDYEDVSYDVESLFTSIPNKKTIDYTYIRYIRKTLLNQCVRNRFLRIC